MKNFIFIGILVILMSSCIPHKELVYFQGEPVSKEDLRRLNRIPYKLQTSDILQISITSGNTELVNSFSNSSSEGQTQQFDDASLYFKGYSIDIHGNIRLPYLNNLNVLGYTTEEVRKKIETELKKYFNNSDDIFVTVKLAGIKYTILGEIGSPGTNIIYQNEVNIIEAIASSGDITLVGDRQNINILRMEEDGLKKFNVDISDIDIFDNETFRIQPNDIIYVRPLKQKSWGVGTTGVQTFVTIATLFSLTITTYLLIKSL